uniref:RING-type domain-containing protein n=1 Tax=Glossina pallidipes TaxID=7398 RepID=A0A1A9Z5T4_GLOPL
MSFETVKPAYTNYLLVLSLRSAAQSLKIGEPCRHYYKKVLFKAGSRQNRLTVSTGENPSSGYVPQAQTQENVSPTSAGTTGASIELPIPSIDLTETPPYAVRFGRQSGNDEIFPIIDLTQTPQGDDGIFVSETNDVSFVSGQASNNNVQRATRRRLAIDDQSPIRNVPSSLHDPCSPLSVTAKKLGSPARFMCPICLQSMMQRGPTSTMCGHVFCQSCTREALRFNRRCSICKAEVELEELWPLCL